MKKVIKIILNFIKLNIQKQLIYRFDTIFLIIMVAVYFSTMYLFLRFVYNNVDQIMGFGFQELLILLLLGRISWFLNQIFIRKGFQYITDIINNGDLDLLMIKPFDLRKLIPFISFDFRNVFPLFFMICFLVLNLINMRLSVIQILSAVFFFINGIIITYSITSILTTLNFWFGRNELIFDIAAEASDMIQYPVDFFPAIFKELFVFIIPLILIINPTFQILYESASFNFLIIALVVNTLIFIISEIFWKAGIKSYSSAN